ncbi:ABC transporter permease [Candidatus Bipolaricaulota bacterium]|nr:ABC transporter permease [Candidatus Bipolaricaulota bacterium]
MIEALEYLLPAAFHAATPILFAALGGLLTELSGYINIGLEGTLLTSAFFAVVVSMLVGNAWVGLLAGVVSGVLISLLLAGVLLKLQANVVIAGFATNLLAAGGTVFLMSTWFGEEGVLRSSNMPVIPAVDLPLIDRVPLLGPALNGHSVLVYLSWIAVGLVAYLIYRTTWGLHLRVTGDSEETAVSTGIDVDRIRLQAFLLSGLLAGLGGSYLSLGLSQFFMRGMSAGRGFIALAAVYFGGFNPIGATLASLLFGFAEGIANYFQSLGIPSQLLEMTPYVLTVLALVIYSIRESPDYRKTEKETSKSL